MAILKYPVQLGAFNVACVTIAGCGGTGSFLALHLARLAYHARDTGNLDVRILLVDPDRVEPGNLGRQNFCPAEVGQYKAEALMVRYNAAFGLAIRAHAGPFSGDLLPSINGREAAVHLVAGCVDNAAARRAIQDAVGSENGRLWWLDCGNHEHAGQVLLGNRADVDAPEISALGFCAGLPVPGIQHPELLDPPPVVAATDASAPSCAELALAGAQGLMVNQAVAGWAATYLSRLLLSRDLDVYATYLDLTTGSARSLRIGNGNGHEPIISREMFREEE